MFHTYTSLRDWGSGQADDNNYDTSDGKEDDGKVQIMDVSDNCWLQILLATRGRLVSKLENHANDSHHESNHQTPKRTLRNGGNTNRRIMKVQHNILVMEVIRNVNMVLVICLKDMESSSIKDHIAKPCSHVTRHFII